MANLVNLVGYHLTFDADMTTAADMEQFGNAFANGDTTLWNNHEAENYQSYDPESVTDPYSFANGALTITAAPTTTGSLPYASGLLQTSQTFQQNQGYFEIRAQTTAAQGFWPAFWLLPTACYPELDILEQPNNSGSNSSYWTHISTPTNDSGGFTDVGVDVSAGYHAYGFMWTATTIQFTFDGSYVGYATATPTALADLKMYMIVNLAVGGPGSWPGTPATGASGMFDIDYIRAYSDDPAVAAITAEPMSSPDGVDTAAVHAIDPVSIGNGPDALALSMSGDALSGHAQFTISVDGRQQGGVQTVAAERGNSQIQVFTVMGTFGSSAHSVSVDFLNDLCNGDGDRNLFLTGATLNGVVLPKAVLNEYAAGAQGFGFGSATPQPAPGPVTLGAGPDTMLFGISEDAYGGDAQFTLSIDGKQQGGVQAATAAHSAGQSQAFAVRGNFGPGSHLATIDFLNDAYAGSASTDRNLYVDSLLHNGAALPDARAALLSSGPLSFVVPPTGVDPSVKLDTLSVALAEDAFQGDAIAQITIDGKVLGEPTVTFLQSAGKPEVFTYTNSFGTGPHTVGVSFLNDAYGGSAQTDRNLYVNGITFNGTSVAAAVTMLASAGTASFVIPATVAPLIFHDQG